MLGSFKKWIVVGAIALPVGVALVGCDKPVAESNQSSSAAEALPADLFSAQGMEGASELVQMKMHASDGDEVLVRAKIGGRAEPFVDGRAAMTVMDAKVKSCKDIPGDSCATPWDYCCEPQETITLSSATVQVVGADGKPLRATLKGANGLKPLDEVIVQGVVKKSPDGKAIVINAKRIFVKASA